MKNCFERAHVKRRSAKAGGTRGKIFELELAFPRAESVDAHSLTSESGLSRKDPRQRPVVPQVRRAEFLRHLEEISPFPHCVLPPHFFERYSR